MIAFNSIAAFVALRLLLIFFGSGDPVGAVPMPQSPTLPSSTTYWVSNIKRQGVAAFGAGGYQVFRNVKDFGARGDGVTDDTAAINGAITQGNRCGEGCDSSTTTPAIVFFPPGTYLVSRPIIQYYYTQFIGDAINLPVLKATSNFEGIAVIDSNPYLPGGFNWYTK